jgi:hypothetical protein
MVNESAVPPLTFRKTIALKKIIDQANPAILLRYYAPPGGGLDEQWKSDTPPVKFELNGIEQSLNLVFSFNSGKDSDSTKKVSAIWGEVPYINGQQEGGYDQHAQYYELDLTISGDSELVISGNYPIYGYMSVTIYQTPGYSDLNQIEIHDVDMLCKEDGLGPFIPGNPSVFSYLKHTHKETGNFGNVNKLFNFKKEGLNIVERDGENLFYRLGVSESQTRYTEGNSLDRGCSGYLYSDMQNGQEILIMRIKVPTTFVSSSSLDDVFGKYQCRELTVSSNIPSSKTPVLNFWTVSSLMLNSFKDPDGYAYIFFAPDDFVKNLATEQGTPDFIPPTLIWGEYTGYVLGQPLKDLIIRYREASNDWTGNPENVTPVEKSTPTQATSAMLGEYLPEVFGDTLEHFNAGYIGAVYNNQSWPSN